MAAYRKAVGTWWMWILIMFSGIGVGIAIAAQFPKDSNAWVIAWVAAPVAIAMGICAWLDHRIAKNRAAQFAKDVESEGYRFDLNPPAEDKAAVWQLFSYLETWVPLRAGSGGIQWMGQRTGLDAWLFEHEAVTGSGKHTQVHTHTAWLGKFEGEGGVSLHRGRNSLWSGHESEVGDPAFDKKWLVKGNGELARKLLSAEVRELLSDSPGAEQWHVGAGWIACLINGPVASRDAAVFVRRCDRIADAMRRALR